MEQKTVGIVLHFYRKKYKLSQEEICSGICSVTKLSRLEKGYREMDSLICTSLLGRIGKEVTLFETMLNEEDYELWKIRTEIADLVEKDPFSHAKNRIASYRKQMPQEQVHEQFCLYQEARILLAQSKQEADRKAACAVLERGIRLTVPGFGENGAKKQLYNLTEIEMILHFFYYAAIPADVEETELLRLLECVHCYYSPKKKEQIGTEILLALIAGQKRAGNPVKQLLYLEQAIAWIKEGTGFQWLAELYFEKVQIAEQLFGSTAKEQRKQWIEECKMAYYLFGLQQNRDGQRSVEEFCKEKLKCQITGQEM